MARVIGGIGASHTPTIGFARDHRDRSDPVWGGIFAAFEPVADWLAKKRPNALVFIYNDHVTSFFFDHYSAFALGIGNKYAIADEGGYPRALPEVPGAPELAVHIGKSLTADQFDLAFFQNKGLDHGCLSPLSMMFPVERGWPTPIVPLQVGVLQAPSPTARRCYDLGKALVRAIESYPADITVAVVATGGLSHQVHGARAGFNDTSWDERFLDLIEQEPDTLADMTAAQFAELGGYESAEVVMWLIMRGALGPDTQRVHRAYYLPSMTGIATLILENGSRPVLSPLERQRQLHKIARGDLETLALPGTHPFTTEVSVRCFRLNNFLHQLIKPDFRQRFVTDPASQFEAHGLTDQERRMVLCRDWKAMIEYGVIFFLLEKLGAVIGVSNLHIYAAMRGETLEEFQKTRNAPGALYSVAGQKQ
jgi:gallate dioxygenase